MMISPEGYYNEYLRGKTAEQIMTAIKGLKQEIDRLKKKNYQIEQDNEKNYASYTENVRLYMRLREYLKNAVGSDILLSDHCFAVCSNLCEWYYFHADMEDLPVPCSVYSKMRELLPCSFPCLPDAPEQEEWLEEAMLRAAESVYTIA